MNENTYIVNDTVYYKRYHSFSTNLFYDSACSRKNNSQLYNKMYYILLNV